MSPHAPASTHDPATRPRFAMPYVMDCMPVGIGVFDQAGVLLRSNSAFTEMTAGLIASLDEMAPPHWQGFDPSGAPLDPSDYPGSAARAGRMATPGNEFRYLDPAGTAHWFNVSAVPLRHPAGDATFGLALVLEDIGDRKREAARLALLESRFRAFSDHSSCGLWVADVADGGFRFLNPAASRLWPGVTMATGLDAWARSVHPGDRARIADQRDQVARGQSQTLSYRLVDEAGTVVRHLRETSFPIPSQAGGGPAMGGIVESVAIDLPIYLFDPDPAHGGELAGWLQRAGYRVKPFATADALVAIADVLAPGCLLLDVRHAPAEAAALVARVRAASTLPIVLLGPADAAPAAILSAIGAGAADVVAGLRDGSALETALAGARASLPAHGEERSPPPAAPSDLAAMLSPREADVLKGLMEGGTNKSIARALGLSPRTVEAHRARLMDRLQVKTLSALIRYAESAHLTTDP